MWYYKNNESSNTCGGTRISRQALDPSWLTKLDKNHSCNPHNLKLFPLVIFYRAWSTSANKPASQSPPTRGEKQDKHNNWSEIFLLSTRATAISRDFPVPFSYTHESRITYVIEGLLGVGHAQWSHGVCNSGQTALRHILRRHRPRFAHNLRPHVSLAARRRRAFRASDRSETNVHSDVQRSHVKARPRAVLVKGERPNSRAFLLPETVEIPVRRPVDFTALPLWTRHFRCASVNSV